MKGACTQQGRRLEGEGGERQHQHQPQRARAPALFQRGESKRRIGDQIAEGNENDPGDQKNQYDAERDQDVDRAIGDAVLASRSASSLVMPPVRTAIGARYPSRMNTITLRVFATGLGRPDHPGGTPV